MTAPRDTNSFDDIVEWAYGTLPQEVRDLPDFPGIQVVDEPPEDLFDRMAKRGNWPQGTQLLGCYSGLPRTKRSVNFIAMSPELIFVFRGPILRCSRGHLAAEVKRVVWHEVAHWLGHDEKEVAELGLSSHASPQDAAHQQVEDRRTEADFQAAQTTIQNKLKDSNGPRDNNP